jgi:hypothetical protein
MSNMSLALIFALTLCMATASEYEWKGVFYTPEATYKWGAQKVKGEYVDPTMKLAAIPVSAATAEALASADSKGKASLSLECDEVQIGGVITPMEKKCYKLVFDQANSQSLFTINAADTKAIAFFAEHLPTEFEDTEHYLKDTSGVDIEPQAQDPDADEAGHSHGHGGGGADEFEGICICQAQEHNWKLDCNNKAKIEEAVAKLDAKAACMAKGPPQDCVDNYYIMQAHHDHCLHHALPTGIEKKLHDYEHYYDDCFIKRQFDPKLKKCPNVDCSNSKALTEAIATLQAGCRTTQTCAEATCSAAIKTVLMAHDICPESSLPNNLETALHDHEEPCEDQLCNSGDAVFDPYDTRCKADISAASALGSWEAFLATVLALPLAVLISS